MTTPKGIMADHSLSYHYLSKLFLFNKYFQSSLLETPVIKTDVDLKIDLVVAFTLFSVHQPRALSRSPFACTSFHLIAPLPFPSLPPLPFHPSPVILHPLSSPHRSCPHRSRTLNDTNLTRVFCLAVHTIALTNCSLLVHVFIHLTFPHSEGRWTFCSPHPLPPLFPNGWSRRWSWFEEGGDLLWFTCNNITEGEVKGAGH